MESAKEWVEKYGDFLLSYAANRVSNIADAEDLVQETLLSAHKNRDGFKGNSSEKTWLVAILKNKIIDHYRKNNGRKKELSASDKIEDNFFDNKGHWAANFNQYTLDTNHEHQQKEMLKAVMDCKDKLPENFKAAFTLKYLEEMSATEICKVLDISPSNYWVLIHRAKLVLRDCIDKNWKI